jgi:hypothetical protein
MKLRITLKNIDGLVVTREWPSDTDFIREYWQEDGDPIGAEDEIIDVVEFDGETYEVVHIPTNYTYVSGDDVYAHYHIVYGKWLAGNQ